MRASGMENIKELLNDMQQYVENDPQAESQRLPAGGRIIYGQ